MSWIIKQLTGALGPYILIALAVVIAGLMITTKVLWSANTELHEDLAVANASIESIKSANVAGQGAIKSLKDANATWVALFETQKIEDAEAADQAEYFRKQLEAANKLRTDAVRRERQEPDCAAIMQIDIQRVCPAAAERMRTDAARSPN